MFCIVYELPACKRKHIFCYENEKYFYYELFCKRFTKRLQRRIEEKLACPIILAKEIDCTDLKTKVFENIVVYLLSRQSGQKVSIVNCSSPDKIIHRIIQYSKEIHLINCPNINEEWYLQTYGYTPIQLNQIPNDEIVLKYTPTKLYVNGKEFNINDSGYILPEEIAEILPEGIPEFEFLYLLWQYGHYNADKLLPGSIIYLK